MNLLMYRMQYILPPGFPKADGQLDRAASDLSASLKGLDPKWVQVPNSAISMKLNVGVDGASLEIGKREQLVYINLFCLDPHQHTDGMAAAQALY